MNAASWLRIGFGEVSESPKTFRHAALVLRGGNIVSIGSNRSDTHAEVAALRNLWPSERRGCVVVSLRFTATGQLANAKPCPACQAFLIENGVTKAHYTTAERGWETMRL